VLCPAQVWRGELSKPVFICIHLRFHRRARFLKERRAGDLSILTLEAVSKPKNSSDKPLSLKVLKPVLKPPLDQALYFYSHPASARRKPWITLFGSVRDWDLDVDCELAGRFSPPRTRAGSARWIPWSGKT
jgi:hypothetical protein